MSLFYEMDKTFDEIMNEKKNFIFIGEAGSGKSEIVLNTAVKLAEKFGKKVDLFDMDQTKPLFRSRDLKDAFAAKGVDIHYQEQMLDAPAMVGGVASSLLGDGYTLLDIGGGDQAAKFAGGYSHILRRDDCVPVYVVNPYRPWTKTIESLDATMSYILRSVRLNRIYILGNPNLGYHTSIEDFMDGVNRMDELLSEYTTVKSVCARREIYEEAKAATDKYVEPLDLYLTYEWVIR